MPKQLEIERKFILKKAPNLPVGKMHKKWDCYDIYQFYYPEKNGKWARYRVKVFDGDSRDNVRCEYYKTTKKKIENGIYEENENTISKKRFYQLWRDNKPKKLIEKTRFWFL